MSRNKGNRTTYHSRTSKGNDWENVGDHVDWKRDMRIGVVFQKEGGSIATIYPLSPPF